MSNVIKLQRPVERVRIEHRLGSLRLHVQPGALESSSEEPQDRLLGEYQRGVEAGKAEARSELSIRCEERLAEEHARVDAFLAQVRRQFSSLHEQWEKAVIEFAFDVARVIIKREVSVNREIVLGQVREAMGHLVGAENVKLRVHPGDEEMLRAHRAEIFSMTDSLREMIIEVDEKIEHGGCIVESELGNVDARLATQFRNLEMHLSEERSGEGQP